MNLSVFSAVSVKVVGVTRPVRIHTFSPLLALFFSLFHDPNALRPKVLLQPWNGWQAYAFPPFTLLYAILLIASLVLWGPSVLGFPELLDLVSRRFGGSASGQGSVEPASGAVTSSGSVGLALYTWTIQRFLSSRVFSTRVA